MRSLVAFLLVLGVSLVQAISSKGSRLLAILDEVEEKAAYSKFLGDLEGMVPPRILKNDAQRRPTLTRC